jgi:3-hydroxyisobutyrate dehydrogenase-like beta-hydroxyacid dehydrogenase
VTPPGAPLAVAERVADALQAIRERIVYADCNAVSPEAARRIAHAIEAAGSTFIDAAIVGRPACAGRSAMRIYCSVPDTSPIESLRVAGLDVRVIGTRPGEAARLEKAPSPL